MKWQPRLVKKTYYNAFYSGGVAINSAATKVIDLTLPPTAKFAKIIHAWSIAYAIENISGNNVPPSAIQTYFILTNHDRVNDLIGSVSYDNNLVVPFNFDGEINLMLLLNASPAGAITCYSRNCHTVAINVRTDVYFDIEYILD